MSRGGVDLNEKGLLFYFSEGDTPGEANVYGQDLVRPADTDPARRHHISFAQIPFRYLNPTQIHPSRNVPNFFVNSVGVQERYMGSAAKQGVRKITELVAQRAVCQQGGVNR